MSRQLCFANCVYQGLGSRWTGLCSVPALGWPWSCSLTAWWTQMLAMSSCSGSCLILSQPLKWNHMSSILQSLGFVSRACRVTRVSKADRGALDSRPCSQFLTHPPLAHFSSSEAEGLFWLTVWGYGLSVKENNSRLKRTKEMIYSEMKCEQPCPRNTDLGYPKLHMLRVSWFLIATEQIQ